MEMRLFGIGFLFVFFNAVALLEVGIQVVFSCIELPTTATEWIVSVVVVEIALIVLAVIGEFISG